MTPAEIQACALVEVSEPYTSHKFKARLLSLGLTNDGAVAVILRGEAIETVGLISPRGYCAGGGNIIRVIKEDDHG